MNRAILPIALMACVLVFPVTDAQESDPGIPIGFVHSEHDELLQKFLAWSKDTESVKASVLKIEGRGFEENGLPPSWAHWIEHQFPKSEITEWDKGTNRIVFYQDKDRSAEEASRALHACFYQFHRIELVEPLIAKLNAEADGVVEEIDAIKTKTIKLLNSHDHNSQDELEAELRRLRTELFRINTEASGVNARLDVILTRLDSLEKEIGERTKKEYEARQASIEPRIELLQKQLEMVQARLEMGTVTPDEVGALMLQLEELKANQPKMDSLIAELQSTNPVFARLKEMLIESEVDNAGLRAKLSVLKNRMRVLEVNLKSIQVLKDRDLNEVQSRLNAVSRELGELGVSRRGVTRSVVQRRSRGGNSVVLNPNSSERLKRALGIYVESMR